MTTRADVIAAARAYLGTPFHHQGRSRAGLDCAGLVIRVAHDLKLSSFDYRAYGRSPRSDTMLTIMREHCTEERTPAPGLIACLRFDAEPQHLAVLAERHGALSMVHALSTAGAVVEHQLNRLWRSRIVAVFSLPGVA